MRVGSTIAYNRPQMAGQRDMARQGRGRAMRENSPPHLALSANSKQGKAHGGEVQTPHSWIFEAECQFCSKQSMMERDHFKNFAKKFHASWPIKRRKVS